jgi:hypothetical protein
MSARIGFLFFLSLGVPGAQAQQPVGAEPQAPSGTVQARREVVPALPVPRLVKFAGSLKDEQGKPRTGVVGVTFAIYKEQEGGAALWLETQNVQLDEQGHYTALLGATKSEGLPLELFSAGEPRWLGVQVNLPRELEQPRVLLVSVPYALKAADADTLGGKPLSSFVLAAPPAEGGPTGASKALNTTGTTAIGAATIGGGGTQNFVAKFDATGTNVVNSSIFDTGTNVGIGTASPARTLHIKSAAPVIRLEDSTLPNSFWELQQSAFVSDTFGFLRYENGAALEDKSFVVSNAGNLGIGTGTPQRKLHIRSSAPVIRLEDTNLPNSFWELQQSAFVLDTFGFLRYENGAAVQSKSFVMSSGGNFGIGTGTPSQKLEVAGNIRISGAGNALTFPDGTVMSSAATGVGGGTITGVTAGAGLTGGGTTGGVTVGVANGGITNAMLGANSVTNANIAAGSLNPTIITGTAATLGTNTFTGNQSITGSVSLSGSLSLPATTSAVAGVINLGGVPFLHSFGPNNTFVGTNAGNFGATGGGDTAIGVAALSALTTGNDNTANGAFALTHNTTGFSNTAIGSGAMQMNLSGSFSTAVGFDALLGNTSGIWNTATGGSALANNATGSNNTASGVNALAYNAGGSNNTAIGVNAGVTATPSNANKTGSNNTFIGYQAGPGIFPTQLTDATAIGANALVDCSNCLVLGDSTMPINVGIGTNTPSQPLEVAGNVKAASFIGSGVNLTGITAVSIAPGAVVKGLNGQTDAVTLAGANGLSASAGAGTVTVTSNATPVNTANTIVSRDASGNFAAGTITGNLSGNAATATTAMNFFGNLMGEVTGTQAATVVSNAVSANTANAIVRRDALGNFSAGTVTVNAITLASGQTMRGVYGGNIQASAGNPFIGGSFSFPFPLASAPSAPTSNFIPAGGASTTNCPGTVANPTAAPGNLCVYESVNVNSTFAAFAVANTIGAVLDLQVTATGFAWSYGTWAVTAP